MRTFRNLYPLPIRVKVNLDEYWDFNLSKDDCAGIFGNGGGDSDCVAVFIDTDDPECIYFDRLLSKPGNTFDESVSSDFTLRNIGLTGVDNGLISYQKDRISNKQFFDLFTGSTYELKADDKRLVLHKVTGNTQLYVYPCGFVNDEGFTSLKLNGGFFQGFFKLFGYDYQVLPDMLLDEWNLEFVLKKEEYGDTEGTTLNDIHPDNKGIFFYMGTRAENKWFIYYDTEGDPNIKDKVENPFNPGGEEDDYGLNDGYVTDDDPLPYESENGPLFGIPYPEDDEEAPLYGGKEEKAGHLVTDWIKPDMVIDPDMDVETSDGDTIQEGTPDKYEIRTDNKFITFNQTPTGFTVHNWEEGTEVVLTGYTHPDIGNYFTLFNHTCTGYTTETIQNLLEETKRKYDIMSDLKGNAFALRITDDGRIGYRYLVLDCDKEERWGIEEEYSGENVIREGEWHRVNVKISLVGKGREDYCPDKRDKRMRISIYVDGKLKLVSKELPEFDFRQLNDTKDKQEGVPYNISLGGGTQGLSEMITLNYMALPEYVLPLETHFAGTFIGQIRLFRFFTCGRSFSEISEASL